MNVLDTKVKILDAAEELFALQGFDGTSLRAITKQAGVNIAAVNYHFKTKDELIRAVFARRLAPVTRVRLEMLDRVEAEAGEGRLPLERVLEAFMEPILRAGNEQGGVPASFRPLLGRVYTEPTELVQRIFREQVGVTAQRFIAALQRALPGLSRDELIWRVFFMAGSLSYVVAAGHLLEVVSDGACKTSDVDGALSRLIAFTAAGFRAPMDARVEYLPH